IVALPARLLADGIIRIVDLGGGAGWGLQSVGAPGGPALAALTVGAGLALFWASADVRNWTRRAPDEFRALPPRLQIAGVGLAIGILAGFAARAIG
ncbi:MAG TPA: hypothetical protein VFU81_04820, partial [Thermomicrobiales bacterium]|nr:hypothetical protein [Thermomicrobiales bacterium]